ncbi:MAG: DUF4340 domain-containing protein [Desulfatirhabdiaceae bacterium]
MTIRKEYVFIAVAIIALSAYLIFKKSDRTGYQMPAVPTLAASDITKVEMARQTGTVTLEKTDGQWRLQPGNFPANMDKLTGMLQALEKLSLTTLVSESGSLDRYDLGDNQKIRVRAWAGSDLKRDFDLGKVAPTYQHTFVRLPDKPQVYHALNNLRSQFEETVEGLRNKIVLSFNPADVSEFAITSGDTVLKLIKTEAQKKAKPEATGQAETPKDGSETPNEPATVWQTDQDEKTDITQVDRLLGTLSSLRCDGFLNDKNPGDFTGPILKIQLKGKTESTLSVFEKIKAEDKTYPAVSSESPYVFLLADRQVDVLKDGSKQLIQK